MRRQVFEAAFVGYAAYYLVRTNLPPVAKELGSALGYDKAALVSDDILYEVTHFDPRRYFPELFGRFGQLMSQHVQEMKPHLEMKDTMEWKTLEQYYQVDLEGFVGDK
jgi:hypothetical protein